MKEQPHIGVAWFDRDQWLRLTEVVSDRSELDDTFEAWERSARRALKDLERSGHTVEKVPIKIDELLAWCMLHGKAPNGESRAAYVSELLKRRNERKS